MFRTAPRSWDRRRICPGWQASFRALVDQESGGGNAGLALLANAVATGGALVALILAFGSISGAHFNPAVTLCDAWQRGVAGRAAVKRARGASQV